MNTVLIIDDDEKYDLPLMDKLKEKRYVVLRAVGKSDAEKILASKSVDLVVADMFPQDCDGMELIKYLTALSEDKKYNVMVLSMVKNSALYSQLFASGVSYIINKNFDVEVAVLRISDYFESDIPAAGVYVEKQTRKLHSPIDEKLSKVFLSVGIPAHIKGYQFLREAIKLTIDEPNIINSITKKLYPAVAEIYDTSPSKVERAIRHAIEVAWNRGKIENINNLFGMKVYGVNDKPTNGEFIALVADKMIIEGN